MDYLRFWLLSAVICGAASVCICSTATATAPANADAVAITATTDNVAVDTDDLLADFEFDADDDEGSADRLLAAFDREEEQAKTGGTPEKRPKPAASTVADRRADDEPVIYVDSAASAEDRAPLDAATVDAVDHTKSPPPPTSSPAIATGRQHQQQQSNGNAFAAKELRIRNALQRATRESAFTRKFAQILPILRTLNPQQRVVLASLITAQSSAAPGKGLNLKQVRTNDATIALLV